MSPPFSAVWKIETMRTCTLRLEERGINIPLQYASRWWSIWGLSPASWPSETQISRLHSIKTATDSRAGEFVTVNNLHYYSEPANAGGNEFSISTRQPFNTMKYNNNGIGFNPLREKIRKNTKKKRETEDSNQAFWRRASGWTWWHSSGACGMSIFAPWCKLPLRSTPTKAAAVGNGAQAQSREIQCKQRDRLRHPPKP
jgi:hypothetical protein